MQGPGRPPLADWGGASARRRVLGCLLALMLAWVAQDARAELVELRDAQRIAVDGQVTPLRLPLTQMVAQDDRSGGPPAAHVRLRLQVRLGPAAHGLALYLPGLAAHARISVNGEVLEDRLDQARSALPRSWRRIRWLRVPDKALQPGRNVIDIEAAGARALSVSPVWIGPASEIEQAFDERMLATVVGPALVAIVVICLGLSVLVLWARRRSETLYGYFAIGALAWGLHSGWSVLPVTVLQGVHYTVWWTSLYVFFVAMLVVFCTRFVGWRWRAFDRIAWDLALLTPPVLYAARALGQLPWAEEACRAAAVALVAVALAGVTLHAARRRDVTSALLLSAGAVGFALGARDWWVAHRGQDNNPVFLTPYAGLPFIALAAWMLIDGFVRATRELEAVNASLEARVARGSAELRRALDAMRAAKDAAEQADRAKSRFLAAASHDLRQPIHALGLYLGSIAVGPLAAPVRVTLQRMGQSLQALQAMLEALLDISRMDAGVVEPEWQPFDVDVLLRRLGDEFAPLAERKGLRLALRGAPAGHGLRARSDALLFERIVRNLLANAVQYTQHGGVLLSWRLRGAAGFSPRWLVEVRDTGCGIAEAEQARVFDEFYRLGETAQAAQGLGLGLSIVRRLVRLLQLELRLRSWPGRGTLMAVVLPATRQQPQPVAELAVDPMPAGRWVALVEDDPDVLAALRALLAEWQCRWVDGVSGDQVLARWSSTGRPRVDAIIADFRLQQGHTGLDAITQLRAAFEGRVVPALVVTGDAAPERLRALTDSALPWLSKPVPAARLRSWLSTALLHDPSTARETPA